MKTLQSDREWLSILLMNESRRRAPNGRFDGELYNLSEKILDSDRLLSKREADLALEILLDQVPETIDELDAIEALREEIEKRTIPLRK